MPDDRRCGRAGEHVGGVVLRVESVELGALNQGIDRRGAASTGIAASEQITLPAYGNTAQSVLGGIVVERRAAVIENSAPVRPHITESRSEFGFTRELAHDTLGPSGQCFDNWLGVELALLSSAAGAAHRALNALTIFFAGAQPAFHPGALENPRPNGSAFSQYRAHERGEQMTPGAISSVRGRSESSKNTSPGCPPLRACSTS